MVKFLEDEFEQLDLEEDLGEVVFSLAGGEYLAHVPEINNRIDIISKSNADAYQKATYCSIG